MRTVTLNRKVILQQIVSDPQGGESEKVIKQAEVFAAVRMPSLTFRSTMMSAGLETAFTVTLWRSEFEAAEYTHILIDAVPYRIASAGSGVNDMFVNVAVERI